MATCIFNGNAPPIAQVITLTLGGTWEVGDIIKVVFGTKIWTYSVASTTISVITAAFDAAWDALSATEYPEFAEITATNTATTIVLTCDTKGRAIAPVVTTTESDGSAADSQTLSQSTTTANSGPNDWSCAQNWSGGAVPVNSDEVILDGAICNVDIKYGLAQSGVSLTSIKAINGWYGKLGLPERNADGTEYDEYRETELAIGFTTGDFSCASSRVKINGGSVQSALTVRGTGTSAESQLPAFLWRGTHASNTLTVLGGTVGAALLGGHTATILTLTQAGGTVKCSSGVTLTTVAKAGGTLTIESATTTLTNDAGDLTINGTGAHAAITASGGTVNYNTSGTCTLYTGNKQSSLTCDGKNVARTFTNLVLNDSASFSDVNRTVTHSNAIQVFGETVGTRVKARRKYNVTPQD